MKYLGRKERLSASGYPGGPVAYFDFIERWRSSGDFDGLAFRRPGDDLRSAPTGATDDAKGTT